MSGPFEDLEAFEAHLDSIAVDTPSQPRTAGDRAVMVLTFLVLVALVLGDWLYEHRRRLDAERLRRADDRNRDARLRHEARRLP